VKIGQVVQYLERNGHLSENYFSRILGDDEQGEGAVDDPVNNDILVFGPNGKVIRAKTQNQKMMAQVSEKNDIIFVISQRD
jgi:phosphate starvation-inducible PhoH-like protein